MDKKMITHGSLFTGRGGFDVAAEIVGIENIWNCEIDPWLRGKLNKLYPETKQYTNVKYVKKPTPPHIISAGFPCQDISVAKKDKEGIKGSKSGLWTETARVIAECKPGYVLLENSSNLLKQGFENVLSDLSGLGYNVEWNCLRACDFGYPHRRKRVYIIAYSNCDGRGSRNVFQPISLFSLSRAWTPTPAYLRVSSRWADGFRDAKPLQRFNGVPNFRREIKAYGNSVKPIITEYLFRCVLLHMQQ